MSFIKAQVVFWHPSKLSVRGAFPLKDFSNLKLAIFNRYGKKFCERLGDSEGYFWDGKNEIQCPLPTSTYCFFLYNLKNSTEMISKSM